MAAFTSKDPDNWDLFFSHWSSILADEGIIKRTIVVDHNVVGYVLCFEQFGATEVSCWIERQHWGKVIASSALKEFLNHVAIRPLYARAAKDSIGSLKNLQKGGFTITSEGSGFSNARGADVEEKGGDRMAKRVRWATVVLLLLTGLTAAGAWALPRPVRPSAGHADADPVELSKQRIVSLQAAIDHVFEAAAGEPGLEDFPHQVGSRDVRIPSGGPIGTTVPGSLETAARQLPDGTYQVQLIMHWKALGQEGAVTWTYRVAVDGTVTYQGESGKPLPPIK